MREESQRKHFDDAYVEILRALTTRPQDDNFFGGVD
jgi:hypothetical protein